MLDEMGIFRTTVAIAALSAPDDRRVLNDVMGRWSCARAGGRVRDAVRR
jgi:hypothetical protein